MRAGGAADWGRSGVTVGEERLVAGGRVRVVGEAFGGGEVRAWCYTKVGRAGWGGREVGPRRRARPTWVLLHGATLPGPDHPAVVRLAAALAATGAFIVVPDVPAWRGLDLNPAPALAVLRKTTEELYRDPRVKSGGVVLVGLSFGCIQAIRMGAELFAAGKVRAVVGFGGYHDLTKTVRFGLTGHFDWDGCEHHLRPDPYGRWVVAANYLPFVPGCEWATDVAQALNTLARMAGKRRIMSWDPAYDHLKEELLKDVSKKRHDLFRLFAPPATEEPDLVHAEAMAPLLASAAKRRHPELELPDELGGGDGPAESELASDRLPDGLGGEGASLPPVHLLHGRADHLIPYTETLALERRLRPLTQVRATVTALFAHSQGSKEGGGRLSEAVRFFGAVRGLLGLA